MVYLRFFSSCLMSIIMLKGGSGSTFSMNQVNCCTSFMNLARCLLNWKKGRHEQSSLLDSTVDEFLDLPRHILEVATTEGYNDPEILVVGRSACGLSINMKCVGKETNAVRNCGYFPACSAVVMLKIEAKSVCTRTNKSRKITAKQLSLTFGLVTKISIKKSEGKI